MLTQRCRYEGFEVRAALSKMPDFHWCLAPGCKGGQIHETGANGPIFRCNACGYRACVHHNQIWHDGETCEQFDYRISGRKARDEEAATAATIAKTTKKCTKCQSPIEKNKGCDHMTCKLFVPLSDGNCMADGKRRSVISLLTISRLSMWRRILLALLSRLYSHQDHGEFGA